METQNNPTTFNDSTPLTSTPQPLRTQSLPFKNSYNEKIKRHRRSKNDQEGRTFTCPDCDKSYLSIPALTNHRRNKHNYGSEGEKKGRGRPRKDAIPCNQVNHSEDKFKRFFDLEDHRKPPKDITSSLIVTYDIMKSQFEQIFIMLSKKEIFTQSNDINEYSLYSLFINNWNKDVPEFDNESYVAEKIGDGNDESKNEPKKAGHCAVDGILFKYMKDISSKTNTDYFWFMLKFIIALREGLNVLGKENVDKSLITDNKKEFTQIYNAATIPDLCNELFSEFFQKYEYFGLNFKELIEAIQHFCYWLFKNSYTQSHLTLL